MTECRLNSVQYNIYRVVRAVVRLRKVRDTSRFQLQFMPKGHRVIYI